MKQGESKRKQPKDKHTKASWKKRDESRKLKQEEYALSDLPVLTLEDIEKAAE